MFLGVPFNIASYALLMHMLAQQCDLEPGELVWTGGDCHLYLNHLEQADAAARARAATRCRASRSGAGRPTIFDYHYEDFEIVNYQHHPAIKAPVAV